MSIGLLIGSLSASFDPVDRIWHVISYLFLPLSGAFYMVDWIPAHVQSWALLLPTVDCTELLREGFFGTAVHAHYDLGYLVGVNGVLLLLALVSAKRVSVTVEGE